MDDEAEELIGIDPEDTLGRIQLHVEFSERWKRLGQVSQVGVGHFTFDDHVVDIHLYVSPNLVLEHFVDHPLICGFDIFQVVGHDLVVVYPSVGDEGSVLLVLGGHSDLVVTQEGIYEYKEFVS